MNDKQRHIMGWALIGLPIVLHAVFELLWKSASKGIPEGEVDFFCALVVMTGVFSLVRPLGLRTVPRYKR
jgi:hypothetical protein